MRRVEQIMGMPITIDIPSGDEKIFAEVFDWFHEVDKRFSTYNPDSEVSKFKRGELGETKLSSELRQVIEACQAAEAATGGLFSAWAGGQFDPSGYVKGWAIAQAGRRITSAGFSTFCIGAGGDILAGSASPKEWSIGIQNPVSRGSIVGFVKGKNFAVATSGNYERGLHITNPKTGQPANELLSLTVVGPDIITADILATAGFVAGSEAIDLVAKNKGYEALAIGSSGKIFMTKGMSKSLNVKNRSPGNSQ